MCKKITQKKNRQNFFNEINKCIANTSRLSLEFIVIYGYN